MSPTALSESHERVSRAWHEFNNAGRTDVCLRFTNILRAAYPDTRHIIRIKPYNCDLEGFANAGFATWDRDPTGLLAVDAVRKFSAPGPRLDKDPGELVDDVKFGLVHYLWEDKRFLIYELEYKEGVYMMTQRWLFLLSGQQEGADWVDIPAQMDALLLECGRWTKELHEEIYVFDESQWLKSKGLYESVQSASWDDVVLDAKTKAKLIDDVEGFFDNRELYKSFGVPWKRGIILHGVPGNGKTITIKALMHALAKRQPEAIPSLYVKNLDNCNAGGPKYSIRHIFTHARSMAPCILIFEDLDSMVTNKVRSYFLNEVDGIEGNEGILMIGSTNHLDRLDPAIASRPSRFDRKYHFQVPDEHERALYGQYWREKMAGHPGIDFPEELGPVVAKLTPGFSFAYLKELFVASLLILARATMDGEEVVDPVVEASSGDGSSSTPNVVVVEHPAGEEAGDSVKADGSVVEEPSPASDGEKPKEVKPRKLIPMVQVPQSLQDNKLLAVFKAQAQVLLDEMDNTNDGEVGSDPDPEDSDCDSD